MFTLNLISAIIWIIAKTVTGATFTAVGNVVQPNIFLCGKQVTLMCSESSLVLSMKFTLDGIQVASCLFPSCTTNPDFSSNFTMDSTKGIFNFTLHAVKTSDNGRDFICNINENDQQIIPKVAELPQNNSLVIQSYKVPSGTEIKAIIGCVFPNTSIRFEWYTVKVSNETDVKPYYATDNTTEPNNTLCAPLSNCKGSGLSNAFVIQEGGNSARGEVYLEVHVIHDYSPNQLIAVKRTFYSFNISDPVTTTTAQQTTPPSPGVKCHSSRLCLGLSIGLPILITALITVVIIFVFLIKDPVYDLKISSKSVVGNKMRIKLQWTSRLYNKKTFHIILKDELRNFTECKDGFLEQELIDLDLDSNYSLCVYSTMCAFQSIKTTVKCNTKAPPFPPYNFCEEKTLRTGSSVTLNWNRAKGPKHTFVIKYQITNGRMRDWMFTERINDTRYTLDGLKPGTRYTLLIHAENDVGYSEDSEPLLVKTRGPPFPPYNLCEETTLRTDSSVTINWNRAKGPKHTFVIKYKRTKGRMRDWMFTERINDTRYTLDGLKPGTSYTLLIHAENDIGYSKDSEPLLVKTRALNPVPPEEFRCESVKENEAILSWKPFKNIRKQQFILTFYNMSEELSPGQERKDTEICIPYTGKPMMTYKVMELKPSSKYMFELYTSAGKRISERSAIASVETADRDEDTDGVHGKGKLKKTTSVFHIAHT